MPQVRESEDLPAAKWLGFIGLRWPDAIEPGNLSAGPSRERAVEDVCRILRAVIALAEIVIGRMLPAICH
jgi:hypothetical protein